MFYKEYFKGITYCKMKSYPLSWDHIKKMLKEDGNIYVCMFIGKEYYTIPGKPPWRN